ncbi:diguanylate cyclase domain-containing protein [Psychromonas sp. MB-3u-54]|uniref:diguanylate cyclase domain-containing protein n=1 Tax=Psychromonas sp. MB-3u-54 TaxID=2058319 RepID=UPI001E574B30|nr:GGDEF domain-containing protein [Psychromonas sp. MB-3u-54]
MISKRLLELVRQSDTVARLGGDEFVFVLNNPKIKNEILQVAERIISAINEPVQLSGSDLEIGVSIGISMFPDDRIKSMDLIKKADQAMHLSKTSGRNSVDFFVPEFD